MCCMIRIQNPVYYKKFRHIHVLFRYIQPHCHVFRTMYNTCIFRNLPYSESWHTYNARYIQNSVKEYSDIFRTLCNACIFRIMLYSKFWHSEDPRYIQNPVDLGTFRHIQTYSTMMIIILTL